jgi:hypothetical protein
MMMMVMMMMQVYTDRDVLVPSTWEDSDPRLITNAEEVRLRSMSTKVSGMMMMIMMMVRVRFVTLMTVMVVVAGVVIWWRNWS